MRIYVDLDPFTLDLTGRCRTVHVYMFYMTFCMIPLQNADMLVPQHTRTLLARPVPPSPPLPNRQQATSYL
jgi:hypothetical protein